MFDVDEALNLNTSKIETEVTGERIVKEIQEWLLTQKGSGGTAILPEDKTQHLLVGVSERISPMTLQPHSSALVLVIILLSINISGLQPTRASLSH